MTFVQWLDTFPKKNYVHGYLAEEGYVFYLEKKLHKKPTIEEIKKYGKINRLLSDGLPI